MLAVTRRAGPALDASPLACRTLAESLERWPAVRILDTRDEAAFALGHPEGAGRLSPAEFTTRRMELPARETAVLVVDDEPARAHAAGLELSARGFTRVAWLDAPITREPGGRISTAPAARLWSPSPFVESVVACLPERAVAGVAPPRRALDLACGSARAAVFLALEGWDAEGWDVDPSALERARAFACRQAVEVRFRQLDLEAGPLPDPEPPFDLIVVVRYLHRPLFPWIERALAPGGVLVYETFRDGQQRFGPPRREQHLLRPGELLTALPSLVVERYEETADGVPPLFARLVARKPG